MPVRRISGPVAASAAAAGKKYMSLKVVMPPEAFRYRRAAVPSRTKSSETLAASASQIVPLQPVHERQVVGEAAHGGHGGVGVQVDGAGNEKMVRQRPRSAAR